MNDFEVACDNCGETYHTDESHAGRTITCIKCKQPLLIQSQNPSCDNDESYESASWSLSSPLWRLSLIDYGEIYRKGIWIVGIVAAIIAWIYAIASYGFFLGLGLGWIPSAIIGALVGFLWPLLVVAGLIFLGIIIYAMQQ